MYNILVCDDDAGIRTLISKYAKYAGHNVTEAENGRQAVELCHKHHKKCKYVRLYFSTDSHIVKIFFYTINHNGYPSNLYPVPRRVTIKLLYVPICFRRSFICVSRVLSSPKNSYPHISVISLSRLTAIPLFLIR